MQKIGILGGGQLAMMLAEAGKKIGIESKVVNAKPNSSSSFVTETLVCDYLEVDKIIKYFEDVDVVTYEFENIPQDLIQKLSEVKKVFPPIKALDVTKHRVKEKNFLKELGVAVPNFVSGNSFKEILEKVTSFPIVVKTCSFGYDGKGQWRFFSKKDLENFVNENEQELELIAEEFINFDYEVSCIAARAESGEVEYYPLCQNDHKDGILFETICPSIRASKEVESKAKEYTKKLLEGLDYVGILAVEYFVSGESVLFNEYAPRVHNSGHGSIEGTNCSQFENHLRACLGMELGDASNKGYSLMHNLLGIKVNKEEVEKISNANYHWYQKDKVEGRRKVGHLTFTFETKEELKSFIPDSYKIYRKIASK